MRYYINFDLHNMPPVRALLILHELGIGLSSKIQQLAIPGCLVRTFSLIKLLAYIRKSSDMAI